MRSHFGASSMCASAFRISSLRSPLARGMGGKDRPAQILSRALAEHQAGEFYHRAHAQVHEGRAAPVTADPHGRHAEAVRRAQVVERIVDEGAAMRIEVVVAQQHMEALQGRLAKIARVFNARSEEHTSELQSRRDLVCRLLLEKKKKKKKRKINKQKKNQTQS